MIWYDIIICHLLALWNIYFLLNEHPSVNLALPPVGVHNTVWHDGHTTVVFAWEKTVVLLNTQIMHNNIHSNEYSSKIAKMRHIIIIVGFQSRLSFDAMPTILVIEDEDWYFMFMCLILVFVLRVSKTWKHEWMRWMINIHLKTSWTFDIHKEWIWCLNQSFCFVFSFLGFLCRL